MPPPAAGFTVQSAAVDGEGGGPAPAPPKMRRSWCGQLREMMVKSWLVKRRRKRATATELGYPAYFMMILWVMKGLLPGAVDFPEARFPAAVPVQSPGGLTCLWSGDGGCDAARGSSGNGTWAGDLTLGYVNGSAPAAAKIAQDAVKSLGSGAHGRGFASAAAMERHAIELQQPDADRGQAYLFFGVEIAADATSYTLRWMPSPPGVGVPGPSAGETSDGTDCRPRWEKFVWNGSGEGEGEGDYGANDEALRSALPKGCQSLQYLTDGFVALQVALDRAILQAKLGESAALTVSVEALPRIAFESNFSSANYLLRSIFSIYIVLALGSPIRWMITFLVEEKETKVKEGMLMMGLHPSVFWACWGLTYVIVDAVISLIVTIVMCATGLLAQSSPLLVFILLWSFCVSTIPFCFAMSTFITNVRAGGPLASMLVSLLSLPFVAVVNAQGTEGALSSTELWWSALVSPLAFCLGMDSVWTFDAGYQGLEGMQFNTIDTPGPLGFSLLDSLTMLWLDTVLLSLLALYDSLYN